MCKLVSVQYVRYENSLFTFQFIGSASQFPLFFARNSSLIWNASNPCHGHFFCFCFVFTPTPWKFQLSFILSLRKLCHVRPSFPLEFPMTLCEGVMDVFWNHTIQQRVIPEKIHTPPTDGVVFQPPLSPGFPEASCLDFQNKRPPLPPGFPEKNIRLKFNLLLIENTHNYV